ncbi:MAG: sodium:solute symporter [Pirellulaceae bacterium]
MTSNFGWLDGCLVGVYLALTMWAGVMVRKHVRRVDHFLVAGREMNVYLGIASLAATEFGIITCMYTAEAGYRFGFAGAIPGILNALAMLFVGLTGFCVEPLRASGVLTLPELFERRFGRRVRVAAGVVIALGGLLNMGVFLRMGGEFLIGVVGMQVSDGSWASSHRLELTMSGLLFMVAVYTILGGMLSVLVTDFMQFVVMSLGLLITTFVVLQHVGWDAIVAAVETHRGESGFNPLLRSGGVSYVLFNALVNFSAVITWMAVVQRVLAAKDAATGRKIYTRTSFFFVARWLIPAIWGMAALAKFGPDHNSLQAMPQFLAGLLPTGLIGLLVAAMLAAEMSTDSGYMLTWASVIYNDILAPFRQGWSEARGLLINRMIVGAIGLFLLGFGLWYEMKGPLWTYLAITGTIYLSSMSTLLVAACYWRGANAWGAVGAIVCGAALPGGYLVLKLLPATSEWALAIGEENAGIAAYVSAAVAMVAGSWLRNCCGNPSPESHS